MDRVEFLRSEICRRRGTWKLIVSETGWSYWTLSKFARGVIDEPGAKKLDVLSDWLEKNPDPRLPARKAA